MTIFPTKRIIAYFTLASILFVLLGCKKQPSMVFNLPLKELQDSYITYLDSSITYLNRLKTIKTKKDFLKNYLLARHQFKLSEPILAFVNKEKYKALNGPNILKIEEHSANNIEIKNPYGFQVIEEFIFEDSLHVADIQEIAHKTQNELQLIKNNTELTLKDYEIVWLIREEVARIALTGITGFDSPVLEQSLSEAITSYTTIKEILNIYKSNFKSKELYQHIVTEIQAAQKTLKNSDFKTFNRYNFIKLHTHKQLELLQSIITDWNVKFPEELALSNTITSLFSTEAFNMSFFSNYNKTDTLIAQKRALGKQLFNDQRLSTNGSMSCATCHNENKAFTDGLKTFPKQTRNTPMLTYSALQQSFFYDGRKPNLETQIMEVVNNKNEFHSNANALENVVANDANYVKQFNQLYKQINHNTIRNAIVIYVSSLGDFSSKFDKNVNGLENTITQNEVNGFNLFMGKAKCATCHFAPVFNGTVPPNFTETEFELLGVPNDTTTNFLDTDFGRYNLYKTKERKHFFKTPSIRNISKTAPYMHNGVYTTLNQVMTFYNDGGGAGLGIDLEHQTLPPDALNLTDEEVQDIIMFMESLTDKT